MRRIVGYILVALLCAAPAGVGHAAEVSLEVSSRETYVNQSITIQITVKDASAEPVIELPEVGGAKLRLVGSPMRSQRTLYINGRRTSESSIVYQIELIPSRVGTIRVPAIAVEINGKIERTAPFEVVAVRSDTGDRLFVEVLTDRRSLYIGESFEATLRIWIKPYSQNRPRVSLDEREMWRLLDPNQCQWGVFQASLDEMATRNKRPRGASQLRRDAKDTPREYFVYQVQETIWPQRPGQPDFGDISVVLRYPVGIERDRSIFSFNELKLAGVRPITAEADPPEIEVKAVPSEGQPELFQGAVSPYALEVEAKPTDLRVGDPITLTMKLSGKGRLDLLRAPKLARVPELTESFQVPDEELAGTVVDGAKRFTQSIFPKNDKVTEIPPIPFVYFDPRTERFITVHSDPVPITVEPAQRMNVTQVIESTPTAPTATSLTEVAGGMVANYYRMDEVLTDQSVAVGPTTAAVAAGPPFFFLVCWVAQRRQQRLKQDVALARRRTARRNAMDALHLATGPRAADQVAAALLGYVADRLNLPTAGMTRADAKQALGEAGIPAEVVAGTDALLAECDNIRYAGAGEHTRDDLVGRARRCIKVLERQRP